MRIAEFNIIIKNLLGNKFLDIIIIENKIIEEAIACVIKYLIEASVE